MAPGLLFAYKKVFFENEWHIKYINCCDSSEGDWEEIEWHMATSSGVPINFRTRGSVECLESWWPVSEETGLVESWSQDRPKSEKEILYEDDLEIESLDSESRSHADCSQCASIIISHDVEIQKLPFFISAAPVEMSLWQATIKFESPYLKDLPNVTKHLEDMAALSGGIPWLHRKLSTSDAMTRIPENFLMPVKVLFRSGAQVDSVYGIKKWLNHTDAVINIYSSAPIPSFSMFQLRSMPSAPYARVFATSIPMDVSHIG